MDEIKVLSLRMQKDLWKFLRTQAFKRETSITELINRQLTIYKKKYEKKLTKSDTVVS